VGGRRGNGIGERGRKGEISQYFSLPKDIEDGEAQVFCFVLFCFVLFPRFVILQFTW
jgi:hypothetical protein